MLKFRIVLSAVFFIAAANANSINDVIPHQDDEGILQCVGLAENTISRIQKEIIIIKKETEATNKTLTDISNTFREKMRDRVVSERQEIIDGVGMLAVKVRDVNIEQCLNLSSNLGDLAEAAIVGTNVCTDKAMASRWEYIRSIDDTSNRMITELEELKKKVKVCIEYTNDVSSTITPESCALEITDKASQISQHVTPNLRAELNRPKLSVVSLKPKLDLCSLNSKLGTFFLESRTLVEKTDECIQKKIEENVTAITPSILPD